jgi:hypothetical protein
MSPVAADPASPWSAPGEIVGWVVVCLVVARVVVGEEETLL